MRNEGGEQMYALWKPTSMYFPTILCACSATPLSGLVWKLKSPSGLKGIGEEISSFPSQSPSIPKGILGSQSSPNGCKLVVSTSVAFELWEFKQDGFNSVGRNVFFLPNITALHVIFDGQIYFQWLELSRRK
jgi:hypothetical protein